MRGSLRQEMGMQEGNQFSMSYKDDHHHQQQKAKISPDVEAHQALKCPRCDSPNTKFCYYNNYNLTQPRHFCKTCRRYWTKGGALRNVPVGGGCRKNKRSRQRSKDRIPLTVATDHHHSNPNPNPQGSSSPGSNLSLMQNLWGASNSSILDLVVDHQQPPVPPMAGLVYENPAFGFEPASFGNLSEDIMQWRIQQQSKLAALQQHLDGNSIRGLNHGNANDSNGVDLMLISSANDQKYSDHEHDRHHHHYQQHQQQQQKGKSIASSDLQAEWPAMADCLLEESTSAYWYGLQQQQLAEN